MFRPFSLLLKAKPMSTSRAVLCRNCRDFANQAALFYSSRSEVVMLRTSHLQQKHCAIRPVNMQCVRGMSASSSSQDETLIYSSKSESSFQVHNSSCVFGGLMMLYIIERRPGGMCVLSPQTLRCVCFERADSWTVTYNIINRLLVPEFSCKLEFVPSPRAWLRSILQQHKVRCCRAGQVRVEVFLPVEFWVSEASCCSASRGSSRSTSFG